MESEFTSLPTGKHATNTTNTDAGVWAEAVMECAEPTVYNRGINSSRRLDEIARKYFHFRHL